MTRGYVKEEKRKEEEEEEEEKGQHEQKREIDSEGCLIISIPRPKHPQHLPRPSARTLSIRGPCVLPQKGGMRGSWFI